MFLSFLFIVIGAVFLLKNLGFLTGDVWGIIWPLILIVFGIYLALKTHRLRLFLDRIWKKIE
jgi:uncharacterized membrane protein